jgi:succinoglycan biosynthesis transport protein ExoP
MASVNNNTDTDRNSGLPVQQGNDQTQENLLWIILRHRWIVLSAAVVCVIAAFTYLLKATPIYTSASRLYVEQTGPKIINDYEGYMTRSNNYLYTQAELMRSTPIISEVANDARIRYLGTFANVDNLMAYLKKNVQVSIGKKDDIITVSFDSPYPEEAAEVVNVVVDSYVGYHSTRKRSTVSEVLKILQTEKQKRNKELSEKYAEILEFTRENGIVSFDNEGGNKYQQPERDFSARGGDVQD